MAVLNLRNVPADLTQRLRISAARAGEKLHQHAIRLLDEATGMRAGDPDSVILHGGRGGGKTARMEAEVAARGGSRLEIEIT